MLHKNKKLQSKENSKSSFKFSLIIGTLLVAFSISDEIYLFYIPFFFFFCGLKELNNLYE